MTILRQFSYSRWALRARLWFIQCNLAAFFVLFIGLLGTWKAWDYFQENTSKQELAKFEKQTTEVIRVFERSVASYSNILMGFQGLFAASETVNTTEFSAFCDSVNIFSQENGIIAVEFYKKVGGDNITNRSFQLTNVRTSLVGIPVINRFLPQDPWEVSSSLQRALRKKSHVLSRRFNDVRYGTNEALMRMSVPVYKMNLANGQMECDGVLSLVIRADDFFHELVITSSRFLSIGFEVYDGGRLQAPHKLYSTSKIGFASSVKYAPRYEMTQRVYYAGNVWTLYFWDNENFSLEAGAAWLPLIVTFSGLLSTLLIFSILYMMSSSRARAMRLAEKMTQHLRESEQRSSAIMRSALDAVISINELGSILEVNNSALALFGYQETQMVGRDIKAMIVPPTARGLFQETLTKLSEDVAGDQRSGYFEMRLCRSGNAFFTAEISVVKLQRLEEITYTCFIRDITERKNAEELARKLSLTDELTGLYNRRGFLTLSENQLRNARRSREPLLLFFADLDDLKGINDKFGHEAGDEAIRKVADILKKTFRDGDIISRFGGDEFAILLVQTAIGNHEQRVRSRIQTFLNDHNSPEAPYKLSLTLGASSFDTASEDATIDTLMSEADRQLYELKRSKKSKS